MRVVAGIRMALVALGFVLICWRMLTGRSARWLIDANALSAVAVLSAGTVVDIHARVFEPFFTSKRARLRPGDRAIAGRRLRGAAWR